MLKTASNTGVTTGSVVYQGVWNASTNTPTLVSSVGTQGNYYVVSVAGSTNLNGVTLWGVGDWAIFNGLVWQKVDAGDTTNVTSITVTGLTGYMYANNTSPVTASTTIPNLGLANSTTTLGNATITLGGTTTSVGNLTLTNATISSSNVTITGGSINVQSTNLVSTTSVTATYGTASLPLQPLGFIQVDLNGTVVKVPYYAV